MWPEKMVVLCIYLKFQIKKYQFVLQIFDDFKRNMKVSWKIIFLFKIIFKQIYKYFFFLTYFIK